MIDLDASAARSGSADRQGFLEAIDAALRASERQRVGFAILRIDLGSNEAARAKAVGVLRANVRLNDVVAALAEQEFAVLLGSGTEGGARRVAGKIAESLLAACSDLVAHDVSIGVAVFPAHGNTRDELLHAADAAQYQAKRTKRGIVVAVQADESGEEALLVPAVSRDPDSLSRRMGSAVEKNEFVLRYQPAVNLATGHLLGAEALVRWRHPELGLLPAAEFLYLAERDGSIDALSLKFVEYALLQARAWRDGGTSLPVSVNLPASTLQRPMFGVDVVARLHELALSPDILTVELRDDQLTRLSADAMKNIFMLANDGVRVAIDNFGRGAASLLALRDLPVQEIKIDPCFTSAIATNTADAAIVATLVRLCRDLGRRAIAKGIENQAACDKLRELGCEGGQGFYFAQAMDADALPTWRPHIG